MAPTLEKPSQDEPPVPARPPKFDAKAFLELTLPRQKGDTLKVTPIPHSDHFRVNWYTCKGAQHATIPGLSVVFIRDSKFVSCRLGANGQPEIVYPPKQ